MFGYGPLGRDGEAARRVKVAGPSFRPGRYEKLSNIQKIFYWMVVIAVFLFIATIWLRWII